MVFLPLAGVYMSCFFTVVRIVVCNRPYILTSSIIGLLPLELLWSSSPIPLVVHGVFNPNTNKKTKQLTARAITAGVVHGVFIKKLGVSCKYK